MLESLKNFKYIFVTGPQRAGTTITSKIIAHDLGYHFYEAGDLQNFLETTTPSETDPERFIKYHKWPFVLQCPYLSSACHLWCDISDLAVVMVIRPIEDIIASQERINWGFESVEKQYYPEYLPDEPISSIKYKTWENLQKGRLGDKAFEVHYNDLKDHSLFVPKSERKDFWSRQTEIGKPLGERIQSGGPGIGKGVNEIKT